MAIRPPCDLDDYLERQQKLQQFKDSGLTAEVFCLHESISKSTFHRWKNQLKEGIAETISEEAAQREQAESTEAVFMPITLKASPVEIELPNGGVVRLPLGVGQVVLVEVIRAVGALVAWKLWRGFCENTRSVTS